ncbi:MAG: response regulator [Cytophagales bacterium]|nr:response regulator [Cytophagales bacterium]
MSESMSIPPPASRPGLRLLVAEDNLINQRIVKELLRKEGHEPTVVSNGREALEALGRQPFDAVILDYQMPEMDGLQALHALRTHASPRVRELPVLFFTGEADEGALALLGPYGVVQTLQKPIEPRKLLNAVARLATPAAPEPAPPLAAPIDYLRDITGGDAVLMAELVDIFAEEVPAALRRMQACHAAGDWPALLKVTHRIQSNYKYVGMTAAESLVRSLAADAEHALRTDTYAARIGQLQEMTNDFITVLLRKKQELLQGRAGE